MTEKYFEIRGVNNLNNKWEYSFAIPKDSSYNNNGDISVPFDDLDSIGDIGQIEGALSELFTEKVSGLILKIIPAAKGIISTQENTK